MTKPEKRWQLLLVADDGRIVPFKHIKGLALTLLVLLVLLTLMCAGLGWQLTREKRLHDKTHDKLISARQEAANYKSEYEIVTAELVLTEARMEKAGLAVTQVEPEPPLQTVAPEETSPQAESEPETQVVEDPPVAEDEETVPAVETQQSEVQQSEVQQSEVQQAEVQQAEVQQADVQASSPTSPPESENPPNISLGELNINQNFSKGKVTATFRLSNQGPRSTPAKGVCLVVLKSDPDDTATWLGLPGGSLVNGAPKPEQGKKFRFSRFVDVDLNGLLADPPLPFTRASLYIFDEAGALAMKKDYPITIRPAQPLVVASTSAEQANSQVVLSRFEIHQDASDKTLWATFRLRNVNSQAGKISGHCLVLFKNDQLAPDTWVTLPASAVVDGKPQQEMGYVFKMFRFTDVQIKTAVDTDPSRLNRVIVYVFDKNGDTILEKAFSVHLAAFKH